MLFRTLSSLLRSEKGDYQFICKLASWLDFLYFLPCIRPRKAVPKVFGHFSIYLETKKGLSHVNGQIMGEKIITFPSNLKGKESLDFKACWLQILLSHCCGQGVEWINHSDLHTRWITPGRRIQEEQSCEPAISCLQGSLILCR